jgi:hypothetical protein
MKTLLLLGSVPSGVYDDLAQGVAGPVTNWGAVWGVGILLALGVAAGWGALEARRLKRRS